jgi:cbb3-type cytochrome oxidase subunit 3
MLRYIKHNLTEMIGVEIYPIISLLIFVLFFAIVIWRTFRMSKAEVNTYSNIPLDSDEKYLNKNNTDKDKS